MLILILVACLTLSWSVTCVRINYYLQSVVLTGFVFFSQFFWALRFLFRLNDSILMKFLVFQVFFRNTFVWINTVVVLSVSYCDDSLLCFVTRGPAIVLSQKSDLELVCTFFGLRWLPGVFTNNPSYLAYVTEGNLINLSLRFCSRDSPLRLPI